MCSAAGGAVAAGSGSVLTSTPVSAAEAVATVAPSAVGGTHSRIRGGRSGQGCGDGCGRLCGVIGHGRGRHREMGGRATSGSSSSMGVCSTECAVSTDNRGGDIGSHVDSHIITHIMGD